jgi:PAS domain S-box-containing protein
MNGDQPIRILILEDNIIDRRLIQAAVERLPFAASYESCATVEQGRRLLSAGEFNIVISDYTLEDGVASELFDLISCPFIVITGATDQAVARTAMQAGASDFISKGSNINLLKEIPLSIERALRSYEFKKHNEMLLHALKNTGECIVLTDKDDKIIFANPAFHLLTGISTTALQGQKLHDLDILKYEKPAELKTFWKGEAKLNSCENLAVEILLSISPTFNQLGQLEVIAYVIRDVTDIKAAELQKNAIENELRQAQRVEMIGTIAGGVAHDFNNILASVMGYTELALDDAINGVSTERSLREILKASKRGKSLTEQILAFSRRTPGQRRKVCCQQILEEVLRLVRVTVPFGVNIQTSFPQDNIYISADVTEIHQIMMNLVTNALQAMNGKGLLRLELVKMKDGVQITVSDSGEGIPQHIQDQIFQPFFTTKSSGTGMGLALVNRIVRDLGGNLTFETEVGIGTTFYVVLPEIEEEQMIVPETTSEEEIIFGQGRILFVDDEETLVRLAMQMLGRLGYTVTAIGSSVDALNLFKKSPKDFDLVITDQLMPQLQGSELCRELLAIRADIPIVLCSGYSDEIDLARAKEIGFKDYLNKPISMSELSRCVHHALI